MQVCDFCSGGKLGYNVRVMWHTENLGFIYRYKGKSMADWGHWGIDAIVLLHELDLMNFEREIICSEIIPLVILPYKYCLI